jgi:hypothetical protein
MKISRCNIAGDLTDKLGRTAGPFMKDTQVTFLDGFGREEQGVDEDGLTRELYTEYWKQIVGQGSGGGVGCGGGGGGGSSSSSQSLFRAANDNSLVFLPVPHDKESCSGGGCGFYDVGRILLKCFLEMHVLPRRYFPRTLLQYLVSPDKATAILSLPSTDEGVEAALNELRGYDEVEAKSLHNMYQQNMDGAGFEVAEFDGSSNTEPVTNDNKAQCIIAKVKRRLLIDNRDALDCMRDGFRLVALAGKDKGEPTIDITSHLVVRVIRR